MQKGALQEIYYSAWKTVHIRKIYRFPYSVIRSLVGKWQLGLADISGFNLMTASVLNSVTEWYWRMTQQALFSPGVKTAHNNFRNSSYSESLPVHCAMKHYITAAHGQLSAINVDDCNRPIVTMQNDNLVRCCIPRISRLLITVLLHRSSNCTHVCSNAMSVSWL